MNHFSCYWTFSLGFGAKKSNIVFHMVIIYDIVLWSIKHGHKKRGFSIHKLSHILGHTVARCTSCACDNYSYYSKRGLPVKGNTVMGMKDMHLRRILFHSSQPFEESDPWSVTCHFGLLVQNCIKQKYYFTLVAKRADGNRLLSSKTSNSLQFRRT